MTADADRVLTAGRPGTPDAELARLLDGFDGPRRDELVDGLRDRLGTTDDPGTRRRIAVTAVRVATLLGPDREDPLRAEAELALAWTAIEGGAPDDGARYADGVRARLAGADDPHLLAVAEHTLGRAAEVLGETAEAVAHWDRATGLWPPDDPLGAATTATAAADLLGGTGCPPAELRDRWARAFTFLDRAGLPGAARQAGVNSSVYAIRALKSVGPADWDARRLYPEALAARELAVRSGAEQEAPHLACLLSVLLSDLAAPIEEIRSWIALARTEYDALDHDPAEIADWQASLDFAEGNATLLAGDPVTAEAPLRAALTRYERSGDTERAGHVRRQLLAIVYTSERGGDQRAASLLAGRSPAAGPDEAAMAAYATAMRLRDGVGTAEAERMHRRTLALLHEAGEPVKAIAVDLEHAMWSLRRGRVSPAVAAVPAARACLAAPPAGSAPAGLRWLAAALGYTEVALADHAGDPAAALRGLRNLEHAQIRAGTGTMAARTAVTRAGRLLAAGDAEEAYATALPAALALDAVRFGVSDAGRRRRWSGIAADGFAVACRAAAALGRTRELGELLEVMRGSSLPRPSTDPADAFDEMLAQAGRELLAPEEETAGPAGPAIPGALAVTGLGRTGLGLPARLRTPWGTVALDDPLRRARPYLDPVRADTVVEWVVPGFSA